MSRAIAPPERAARTSSRPGLTWRRWAAVLLYSLYPVSVCLAIAAGRPRWAIALTCIVVGIARVRRPRWRFAGIALLLASPLFALFAVADLAKPLLFIPPAALNLGLAALFASTLRAGREPLIAAFARAERGTLEADLAIYTRTLTAVWAIFFAGAAAFSIWLAAASTPAIWGWFVAVGNHIAVALLFLGEYIFRRWRFPQYCHASPIALALMVADRMRKL